MINLIPTVIDKRGFSEHSCDIYSKLLNDRIIFLFNEINDISASNIIAQLLYLESLDRKKDIYLYINSPGGSITSGMAIYDTMNYITPNIYTICIGLAASMGAFLLAAGTKNKRLALPNSEIMIHQPLGKSYGQATDIEIQTKRILKLKKNINKIFSINTGQDIKVIEKDTERDNFMNAEEAKNYGIIDSIILNS